MKRGAFYHISREVGNAGANGSQAEIMLPFLKRASMLFEWERVLFRVLRTRRNPVESWREPLVLRQEERPKTTSLKSKIRTGS